MLSITLYMAASGDICADVDCSDDRDGQYNLGKDVSAVHGFLSAEEFQGALIYAK